MNFGVIFGLVLVNNTTSTLFAKTYNFLLCIKKLKKIVTTNNIQNLLKIVTLFSSIYKAYNFSLNPAAKLIHQLDSAFLEVLHAAIGPSTRIMMPYILPRLCIERTRSEPMIQFCPRMLIQGTFATLLNYNEVFKSFDVTHISF